MSAPSTLSPKLLIGTAPQPTNCCCSDSCWPISRVRFAFCKYCEIICRLRYFVMCGVLDVDGCGRERRVRLWRRPVAFGALSRSLAISTRALSGWKISGICHPWCPRSNTPIRAEELNTDNNIYQPGRGVRNEFWRFSTQRQGARHFSTKQLWNYYYYSSGTKKMIIFNVPSCRTRYPLLLLDILLLWISQRAGPAKKRRTRFNVVAHELSLQIRLHKFGALTLTRHWLSKNKMDIKQSTKKIVFPTRSLRDIRED